MQEFLNWAMSSPMSPIAALVGYLLGSIPFGIILTRLSGGPDLRTIGSGNIGATNVLRTGNKKLAAATLVGDMLKGTAAVLLGWYLLGGRNAALLAGAASFIGHLFPVWLKFRGGKGVATFLGIALGLKPLAALVFVLVWLGMAGLTRYSSFAALMASVITPLALWRFGESEMAAVMALLAVLLWIMHRENIKRLITRTEGKIGQKD